MGTMSAGAARVEHDRPSLEESNISARRAASAAVDIGRAVSLEAALQGEQLRNADRLADRQGYLLDRSERALRNLTWGGWIANRFSRAPAPPEELLGGGPSLGAGGGHGGAPGEAGVGAATSSGAVSEAARDYCDAPPRFEAAARAVRDYRCHALLLGQCADPLQREACRAACDGLRDAAFDALRGLDALFGMDDEEGAEWHGRLMRDFSEATDLLRRSDGGKEGGGHHDNGESKGGGAPSKGPTQDLGLGVDQEALSAQEEHLSALSSDLSEMTQIGTSLSEAFDGHNELLDSLGTKSDELEYRTRAVRRRADRMADRARWKNTPPEFESLVTIRHKDTGLFLTCWEGNAVQLRPFHQDASVWELWRRHGDVVGFKNHLSRTWLGQSLLGFMACSASAFGRGEEWEMDGDSGRDRQSTRLLCVGANWGGGGWIEVRIRRRGARLAVGLAGEEAGRKAAMWSVSIHEGDVSLW